MKYLFSIAYVLSIIAINYAFTILPLVNLPWGGVWPMASILAGAVFILRDYAQKEIGHYVLFLMVLSAILSYLLASPFVAVASMIAFAASELIDWAIYSYTNKPFKQRVILSSVIATPIDSAVFLALIGSFSIPAVIVMTLSKLAATFFFIKK